MPIEFKWKTSFVLHNVFSDGLVSVNGIEVTPHPKSSEDSPMVSVAIRFSTSYSPPDLFQHAKDIVERFLDASSVNSARFVLFNSQIEGGGYM